MTEQEEKALRYDRRQRGIELKKSLATTGERIKFLTNEWQTLANNLRDYAYMVFRVEGTSIKVLNRKPDEILRAGQISGMRSGPIPSFQEIASVSLASFDSADLVQL